MNYTFYVNVQNEADFRALTNRGPLLNRLLEEYFLAREKSLETPLMVDGAEFENARKSWKATHKGKTGKETKNFCEHGQLKGKCFAKGCKFSGFAKK